jgi:hypothetical protein
MWVLAKRRQMYADAARGELAKKFYRYKLAGWEFYRYKLAGWEFYRYKLAGWEFYRYKLAGWESLLQAS